MPPVIPMPPVDAAVAVPDAAVPIPDSAVPVPDAAMEDAAAPNDAAPPPDAATSPGCPLVGRYRLEAVTCGTTDVSTMFFASVTSITLGVSESDTGCRIDLVATSAMCTKTSVLFASPVTSGYQLSTTGISACSVPMCTLYENDEACEVGGENYDKPVTLTLADGKLTLDRRDDDGVCAFTGRGPERSVWRSE